MATPSTTTAGTLARQACAKFPSASSRELARKLLSEHPEVYKDEQHARLRVRYYRGEQGKKNLRQIKSAGVGVPTNKDKRWRIPVSDCLAPSPFILPVEGNGLILSDFQIPYHDPDAIYSALEYGVSKKGFTDFLIINGDFLDFYGLSKHQKNLKARSPAEEIHMGRELLEEIRPSFGWTCFKEANHEIRLNRYIQDHAPALFEMNCTTLPEQLRLKDLDVTFVSDKREIRAGHLSVFHGNEHGLSGINPARSLYLKAKCCATAGHVHRDSSYTGRDARGKHVTTWTQGCLCGLSPEWMPYNDWVHGFGMLSISGKDFEYQTKRIINGKVV